MWRDRRADGPVPNPAPDVDLEAPGLMQPPPKPTAPHGEFRVKRRKKDYVVIWLKSGPKDGYVVERYE